MNKFAHIADIHLGAFRDPFLQKKEMEALGECVEKCIEERVDFVLICGDIFHVSIPDLGVVNESIKRLRELGAKGIPIYVIYGSHDYTPNGTSIIDILDTAGVFTNIVHYNLVEGKLELPFTTDKETGAKLTGISARKMGLESKFYEELDREKLEAEEGFKIFAFHSGITELKPKFLTDMETVPLSNFPKNFAYYAGGNIHKEQEATWSGFPKIVYPGPLFTGYGKDIEDTAMGTRRGFFIVSFDSERVLDTKFIELKTFEGMYFEYNAEGKNSHEAAREIEQRLDKLNVEGKVVILRFNGELSGGKTTDIDFVAIKGKLTERGAQYIQISRYGLTSKEVAANRVAGNDQQQIEANLFKENIGAVKVSQKELKGDEGSRLALDLLKVMREKQKMGEQKIEYESRIFEDAKTTLNLESEFEE